MKNIDDKKIRKAKVKILTKAFNIRAFGLFVVLLCIGISLLTVISFLEFKPNLLIEKMIEMPVRFTLNVFGLFLFF